MKFKIRHTLERTTHPEVTPLNTCMQTEHLNNYPYTTLNPQNPQLLTVGAHTHTNPYTYMYISNQSTESEIVL